MRQATDSITLTWEMRMIIVRSSLVGDGRLLKPQGRTGAVESRGGGHTTVLEVDCDTQTHSSLVISSLPSLPLLGQKAHRAELLSSSSQRFVCGCRKLITELHQNLNRQFQAAFLCRAGYTRWLGQRERDTEGISETAGRECESLRQMPHSSHRGYFVTSKWPFWLLQAQDVNVHRS